MSNYPLGAKDDPYAPYNELEKVFNFDLNLTGKIYVAYNGYLDEEEVYRHYRSVLERVADFLQDMGDISVETTNSEIY